MKLRSFKKCYGVDVLPGWRIRINGRIKVWINGWASSPGKVHVPTIVGGQGLLFPLLFDPGIVLIHQGGVHHHDVAVVEGFGLDIASLIETMEGSIICEKMIGSRWLGYCGVISLVVVQGKAKGIPGKKRSLCWVLRVKSRAFSVKTFTHNS